MKKYNCWVVAFLVLVSAIYTLVLFKIRTAPRSKTDCLEKYFTDKSVIIEQYLSKFGRGRDTLMPMGHADIHTIELDDNYRNIDVVTRRYLLQDINGVLYVNKSYFSKLLLVDAVNESKEVMVGRFNINEWKTVDLEEVFRFLIQTGIVKTINNENSEVCSINLIDNTETMAKKYSVNGRTFWLRINKRNGEIWFMIKL